MGYPIHSRVILLQALIIFFNFLNFKNYCIKVISKKKKKFFTLKINTIITIYIYIYPIDLKIRRNEICNKIKLRKLKQLREQLNKNVMVGFSYQFFNTFDFQKMIQSCEYKSKTVFYFKFIMNTKDNLMHPKGQSPGQRDIINIL